MKKYGRGWGSVSLAGEIFRGAVSLIILAIVMIIYFTNYVPNLYTYTKPGVDLTPGINGSLIMYSEANEGAAAATQFTPPSERVIILRLDDIQAYGWDEAAANITETVLERNMSITLGLIPSGMENPSPMRNYLIEKARNPLVEIAQHGTDSHDDDLWKTDVDAVYTTGSKGLEKIARYTGVRPITFVAPMNEYTLESTEALAKLGFRILSARESEFRNNGYLTLVGYTTQTKIYGEEGLVDISKITYLCNLSLSSKNVCVIMIHPQDYVGNDNRIDPEKYSTFLSMLNELQKLDARFVTFKDLVKCETYYWFDSVDRGCVKNQFCGIHTYPGLSKFRSLDECEEALNASITGNASVPEINVSIPDFATTTSTTMQKVTTTSVISPTSTTILSTTTTVIEIPSVTFNSSAISLEVDDYSFYHDGARVEKVDVGKGNATINLYAIPEKTYPGGMDVMGCGAEARLKPGKWISISVEAGAGCALVSYWPGTDIIKSSVAVETG